MTYFKDLSRYEYLARYEPSIFPVLNIGWLGGNRRYKTGETSEEFKEKLMGYCHHDHIVMVTRGLHDCELCLKKGKEFWEEIANRGEGEHARCLQHANGEIRVVGRGVVYAAPTMIYHYVIDHSYKPPKEFIHSVLHGPAAGSAEYKFVVRPHGFR